MNFKKNIALSEIRTQNINIIYPELFEKIVLLSNDVCSLVGQIMSSFSECSDDEFREILKTEKFGEKRMEELLQKLKSDPDAYIEINDEIFNKRINRMIWEIKRDQNYFNSNVYSDSIFQTFCLFRGNGSGL